MSFDARFVYQRLQEFESAAGKPGRFVVAFSGGIDSTVLLHALVAESALHRVPVIAAHVDHGLHMASADWDAQCEALAADLGVEYLSRKVSVSRNSGTGPEAAAREARYAVLGSLMQKGDWLLSAHHENDQAETLLLNLLRGSSLTGLAAIGAIREFSGGFLVRPLLGVSGDAIRNYADEHGLSWTDDPSNADTAFDRNYLRQKVMPLLAARWPAVAARLRQSSDLAAEASELLAELADIDIAVSPSADRLDLRHIAQLSRPRQRNLIRQAVRRCGLPAPPATRLYQTVHELIPARNDAQPLVTWSGGEIRRYRNHLHILAPQPAVPPPAGTILSPDAVLDLDTGQGRLELQRRGLPGIDQKIAEQGLHVRYRQGGEEITPVGQAHRRKLKKLLQEEAIVPWMRDRLPLLFAGDQLVAVADLWVDAEFVSADGYSVRWFNRPALY
jgi:tRNA(Ile)-lysidine synthase